MLMLAIGTLHFLVSYDGDGHPNFLVSSECDRCLFFYFFFTFKIVVLLKITQRKMGQTVLVNWCKVDLTSVTCV